MIGIYASLQLGNDLMLDFTSNTVLVGMFIGVMFPLMAIVGPIYQSVSVELRDSLDITRVKASALTVQFKKLENEYGLSPMQLQMGILFVIFGFICTVVIPSSVLLWKVWIFNLSLTALFLALVFGLISLISLGIYRMS